MRQSTQTAHFRPHFRKSRRRARVSRHRSARVAALLLAVLFPVTKLGDSVGQSLTESQVKAAYLYNFLKFVEWPDDSLTDPHSQWLIGFVGDTPISEELTKIVEGKTVKGRELQVKQIRDSESPHGCNVLFIGATEKKRMGILLDALRGSSVLTVSDIEGFVGSGGMIQFVMEEGRVRFAVDVGAAGRALLKVSSKLLSLASVVAGAERSSSN